MRLLTALAALLALSGCQTDAVVTETKVVRISVPVRAPCPDAETMAKVNAARPLALRDWPAGQVPADEEARQAIERAQLGRYEAPGRWADQAQAVMDRCFIEGVDPLSEASAATTAAQP